MARPKTNLANRNDEPAVATTVIDTELGWIAIAWCEESFTDLSLGRENPQLALKAVNGSAFVDLKVCPKHVKNLAKRLQRFAKGTEENFTDLSVDTSGRTDFQQKVLAACRKIPFGKTISYAELAKRAGSPKAYRAAGSVMASNRTPLLIPCHRVTSVHSLGGFSSPQGVNMKRRLLALEGVEWG